MKNKIFIAALIAIAIFGLAKLKNYWDMRRAIVISPVLTETEKSKDVVDTRARTVTRIVRDGDKQKQKVIRGVRDIAYTVNKDGTVTSTILNKGFGFEPGVMLGTDSRDSLIGLDTQFFYWSEFGLTSGLSSSITEPSFRNLRLHLAVSYNLGRLKLHNTSTFIGYDTKREIIIGARINF